MSVFHYFSKDANKRAKFMFNTIAPIYGLVDKTLNDNYTKSIELLKLEIELDKKSVLDIGTGTGAWAAMFLKSKPTQIEGIDLSVKMLKESKKKYPDIFFSIGNAEDLKDFADDSFDIVTASYVVHGVKAVRRAKMLSEMKRVSKKHVVIHDFVGKTPIFVRFLEFIEKSDYKNFKANICNELKTIFAETKKIPSAHGSGLYLALK
ncbi:MAG: class I SAM-dependent methyltransferase [Bacteroidota bacterium]|nr:class I SAM-dependent methyltransferase [Bacteroidota bacterium]